MWMVPVVLSGRVLRFDEVRGYGFIAPDEGGPDVFVHANELADDDKSGLMPGTIVEFEVMEGERGPKAFAVRVVGPPPGRREAFSEVTARAAGPVGGPNGDDVLCDVLAPSEFREEVTELFLRGVPDLTGAQIVRLRDTLLPLAQKHGWVDE
ncbi:Cold shock-like protein [Actinomadura rubteroloni]|uniref:Cold shock-like protein n=1 Tax=Actinomadura rubteroloni TaxID=1926885 RepID=A0A2P4UIT1_9ACTN|nr:cold shock domain-containing protein [Actinomadura rubteroloni]POM24963.1 Cold shock-like protein [Actinomadura rubteroloni]